MFRVPVILGLMAIAAPTLGEPVPARQAALLHLLKQDCGSCHGLTMKGGLGPPLTAWAIAPREDDVLVSTILDGRPGTPMPPWRFEIAPAEADWLVSRLRSGELGDAR
ncbi:MAG: cytochrome c [Alphaproteobacteria bacterium]|nr:cytochrome c [Alphaproteobacteria bacterium]